MFGTLKPFREHLGAQAQQEQRRFYCGLCKTLGDEFGQWSRGFLSNDAVFMGILVDAFQVQTAPHDQCRCPLMPVQHRITAAPNSVPMRYAAAIQLLLGDQWLADRAMDGDRIPRAARAVIARPAAHAREILAQLHVSLDALEGFEQNQATCEVLGQTTPEQAAAPTANALGLIFETLSQLPGTCDTAKQPNAQQKLRTLGESLGRVIYVTDALEDLVKDYHCNDFNPCLTRETNTSTSPQQSETFAISPARVEEACTQLETDLVQLQLTFAALPWQRHRELLFNIVCSQLPRQAHAAIEHARAQATEANRRRLESLRNRSRLHKFAAAAMALLSTVWVVLIQTSIAWADRGKSKDKSEGKGKSKDKNTDGGGEKEGEVQTKDSRESGVHEAAHGEPGDKSSNIHESSHDDVDLTTLPTPDDIGESAAGSDKGLDFCFSECGTKLCKEGCAEMRQEANCPKFCDCCDCSDPNCCKNCMDGCVDGSCDCCGDICKDAGCCKTGSGNCCDGCCNGGSGDCCGQCCNNVSMGAGVCATDDNQCSSALDVL